MRSVLKLINYFWRKNKMPINNESFGIAAEVAIAKTFNVDINPAYEARAEESTVELLLKNDCICKIFDKENIPTPVRHIAEGQNPIDFILSDNSSLSVKSNQGRLGKVAPQIIGQPTSETYFSHLEEYFKDFSLESYLQKYNLPNTYEGKSIAFKQISLTYTTEVVDMYWRNLFDCDYYLHFYNLENHANPFDNYLFLRKKQPPIWDSNKFSFTQTLDSWNESNTLKYCRITIGEFQVHRNRNCFKFRFNVDGIIRLLNSGCI